ncbi:MAG: hypothetical protein ACD_70C00100G0004 [uncultured bacterium]|nr:MAG: hypothetical protein ACD_70C00100G0004 [uncultured bacterium]
METDEKTERLTLEKDCTTWTDFFKQKIEADKMTRAKMAQDRMTVAVQASAHRHATTDDEQRKRSELTGGFFKRTELITARKEVGAVAPKPEPKKPSIVAPKPEPKKLSVFARRAEIAKTVHDSTLKLPTPKASDRPKTPQEMGFELVNKPTESANPDNRSTWNPTRLLW